MWIKAKDIIVKSNGLFIDEFNEVKYENGSYNISDSKKYIIKTLINSETKNLITFSDKEQARKVMRDFEQAIKNNETFFEIKEKIYD